MIGFPSIKVPIEPYLSGYLDKIGEISLAEKYRSLTNGRDVMSLSNQSAQNILEQNLLSPPAYKLAIDVYLKNNAGGKLLKCLDSVEKKAWSMDQYSDFKLCMSYAVSVLEAKVRFSNKEFGGEDWDSICRNYKNIRNSSGIIQKNETKRKDVALAYVCQIAESGEEECRTYSLKQRNKYPKEYEFQFYYALSLNMMSYTIGSKGELIPRLKQDSSGFEKQLSLLRNEFPTKAAPLYYSMKFYEGKDREKAKMFARKYLELETKPFRVNWKNRAKEFLTK